VLGEPPEVLVDALLRRLVHDVEALLQRRRRRVVVAELLV
jgi:hypothetical protein